MMIISAEIYDGLVSGRMANLHYFQKDLNF